MKTTCAFDAYGIERVKNPWLIQRMIFDSSTEKKKNPTFTELMDLDYMGSAEFEFGAIPRSLSRIFVDLESRAIFKYDLLDYRGDSLCIFARNKSEADRYFEFIKVLTKDRYCSDIRLKESAHIWDHLNHEKGFENDPVKLRSIKFDCEFGRRRVIAWWDVEFDVMFCFGHKKLKKITYALGVSKVERDRLSQQEKGENDCEDK